MENPVNAEYEEVLSLLRNDQYIVINTCHGGFSLSKEAVLAYLEKAGIAYTLEPQRDRDTQNRLGSRIIVDDKEFYDRYDIPRDDPALVNVVRQLGSKSWGEYAKLKIVKVPRDVDWYIEDYDGKEWVAEKHRTWR